MTSYFDTTARKYTLTTDHPSSSYGVPVLVRESTGEVFGPQDRLYSDTSSTACDEVNAGFGREYDRELARKFLGPASVDDLVI